MASSVSTQPSGVLPAAAVMETPDVARPAGAAGVSGVLPTAAVVETEVDFASIYRAHFNEVYRWVTYLGGARQDADDLTQKVFEVVLARLDRFDGRNLKGWLYVITRKTVASYRRSGWVRRWFRREEAPLDLFAAPGENSEQALGNKKAVEWALARMSDKLRVTFILFEIEGHGVEEIGALLGLPTSTVYSRLRLARARFLTLVERLAKEDAR